MKASTLLSPLVVLLLTAIIWLPATAPGAEPDAASPAKQGSDPLRFRRVYVPSDGLEEQLARDGIKYLPMEPAEFEQLLKAAGSGSPVGQGPALTALTSAEYRARLEGNNLVEGVATLEIVHSADEEALLPLEPCRLAVAGATWTGETPEAASLGIREDNTLVVPVSRSGRLQFDWSLGGRRGASGTITLQVALPPCPASALILDLPDGSTPTVRHGVATQQSTSDAGLVRWRIELGGHNVVDLRLTPAQLPTKRRKPTLTRQSLVYDFSLRGLDLSAQLQFDTHQEPLRRIRFTLDPQLQLATARLGDSPVSWSVVSNGKDKPRDVVIEFTEPIQGSGRILRLGAMAPLVTDRPWRLPAVRLKSMLWQEGGATLLVPSPLEVQRLGLTHCRQSKTGSLAGPKPGESVELQYFSPDASVEVVLARPQAPMGLNCGTAVELHGTELTGRVTADFSVADGERFELSARLGPHWTIDSVESVPADALDDWVLSVVSPAPKANPETKINGKQKPQSAPPRKPARKTRKLTVRLAKALSPSRPVRLSISGRRLQSPLGRILRVEDLTPIRFESASGKRLVSVEAAEPYQLHLEGTDRSVRLDPRGLETAELRLFAEPPRGLLFADDAAADLLRVSLQAEKPHYSASVRMEATAEGTALTESYWLHCVPEAARVERIVVHFSQPRNAPPRWTLGADDEQQLTARQLLPAEQAVHGLAIEGETWEVALRRPRSVPFEIRASRAVQFADELPLSLVSLPEAVAAETLLVVRSSDSTPVRMAHAHLKPVSIEAVPAGKHQTARAAYRYDGAREGGSSAEPTVTVTRCETRDALPRAWVWDCQLNSHYEENGTGRHLALYRLESAGLRQLRLTLPAGSTLADVWGVWVDEERIAWRKAGKKEDNRLNIALPPGVRFPVVSVHFATSGRPLGMARSLEPPLPLADVPTLTQHWTAWLPPGYDSLDPHLRPRASGSGRKPWTQRLFGPLGRPADGQPFDPLSAADWSGMVPSRAARLSAERKAEQLLQSLGTLASGNAQAPRELDWGTLLSHDSIAELGLNLLVDRWALERIGLGPRTPVTPVAADTPASRGISLFARANLAVLVSADSVLVTSAVEAALHNGYVESLSNETLWWVPAGPLADRLRQATLGSDQRAFISIKQWLKYPTEAALPWAVCQPAGCQAVDSFGWTAHRLDIPDASGVRLRVVHRNTMLALRWATFLMAVGLVWWKALGRPVVLTAIAGTAGALALLLPAICLPVVSGIVLGVLFCFLLAMIRGNSEVVQLPDESERAAPPSLSATVAQVGIVVFVAATMVAFCASASGAETSSASPSTRATTQRVIIPVDEQQKPTGGKYLVSEELHKALLKRPAALGETPSAWQLSAATYRGTLSWQGSPERLSPAELKAIFELQVFGGATHIRLPFGQQGANLLPNGASLNGQPVQPAWEKDGAHLVLDIPKPGKYRLELALRPTTSSDESLTGFDLAIPRLANSTLELSLPANAPQIDVLSAVGSTTVEADPPRLISRLGPVDRLGVRWQSGQGDRGVGPAVDVEQLLWMKIQPGSVILDTVFKFKIGQGQVRQLELAVDPRLRLLPTKRPNPLVAEVQTIPGDPTTIRFELAEPTGDQVVVGAAFLLQDGSGVGNMLLPRLEARDARTVKRWLAVSIDPALQYDKQVSDKREPVAVPDFAAAWGSGEVQPDFVFNLLGTELGSCISTHPKAPSTTIEQTLAASFGQGEALVRFDAELVTTAGYHFQYRLRAPAKLKVESVSVMEASAERAARWSRLADGTITVFLTGPVSGKHKLSLTGRLPTPAKGKFVLPEIRFEQGKIGKHTVELFRQPAVLIEIDKIGGVADTETPALEKSKAELGRPVGSFTGDGQQPIEVSLALSRNVPKLSCEQATILRSVGKSPEAEIQLQIKAAGGLLDQISLDVPPEFQGPYTINPPATFEIVDAADKTRQLVIRPRAAVDDSWQLSVSSPLAFARGKAVSVPSVVVRNADELRHTVVLPQKRDGEPIDWEIRDLKKLALPEETTARFKAADSICYRVVGKDYRAVLATSRRTRGSQRVEMADVHIAFSADGACHGIAVFDLTPAGRAYCPLHLPSTYRLVQVRVAGVPTTPLSDGATAGADGAPSNQFRLPLGPNDLPQRVEVVFSGKLPEPDSSDSRRFETPSLGDLPVKQTLWTISGPASSEPTSEVLGDTVLVAPIAQELLRMESLVGLMESASGVDAQRPEDALRWYATWSGRLAASERRLRRHLVDVGPTAETRAARAELQSLHDRQAAISERFGSADAPDALSAEESITDCPTELWQSALDRPRAVVRLAADKPSGPIVLEYVRLESGGLPQRLAGAFGLALLAGLAIVGIRKGIPAALFERWPHMVGVAVGLAWWLWLTPSLLGLALVIFSLTFSFRAAWPQSPSSGSTVISLD